MLDAFDFSSTVCAESSDDRAFVMFSSTVFSCFMYPLTDSMRLGIRSFLRFSWTSICAQEFFTWFLSLMWLLYRKITDSTMTAATIPAISIAFMFAGYGSPLYKGYFLLPLLQIVNINLRT